jgi:hypothetical protein
MDPKRQIVRHFLAALAYRTAKALRDAPKSFPDFRATDNVRTPHELLWHMTGVVGYARTFFVAGVWHPERIPFAVELRRFHDLLQVEHHGLELTGRQGRWRTYTATSRNAAGKTRILHRGLD